jgi:hypothetical protein
LLFQALDSHVRSGRGKFDAAGELNVADAPVVLQKGEYLEIYSIKHTEYYII